MTNARAEIMADILASRPRRQPHSPRSSLFSNPDIGITTSFGSSLAITSTYHLRSSLLDLSTPEPVEDVILPQLPIEIICIIFKSVIRNETYDEASPEWADSSRFWIETEKPMFNITMIEKIAGLNQSWLLFVLDCVLHERKILKRKKLSTGLTGSGVCGHGIIWQNYSEGGGEYQRRCLKCADCAEILRHRRTVEHCTHLAGKLLLVNADYSRVVAEAQRIASLSRNDLGWDCDVTPFGFVYRSPEVRLVPGHILEKIVKDFTDTNKHSTDAQTQMQQCPRTKPEFMEVVGFAKNETLKHEVLGWI